MEIDPNFLSVAQRDVYRLDEINQEVGGSQTELWEGLIAFTSPDLNTRRAGLEMLVSLDVAHRSPLAAYILATRLDEPDLALRTRIVQVLGAVLGNSTDRRTTVTQVRLHLGSYLSQIRTRRIFALLQVAVSDPSTHEAVSCLLNLCPHGGTQLGNILSDRGNSLSVRKHAAEFISCVGYLDALPVLERQSARLEKRLNGNKIGDLTEEDGEVYLLPAIHHAINMLKAP